MQMIDYVLKSAANGVGRFPKYGADKTEGLRVWNQEFCRDLVATARIAGEDAIPKLQEVSRQLKSAHVASLRAGKLGQQAEEAIYQAAVSGLCAGAVDAVIHHVLKGAAPSVSSPYQVDNHIDYPGPCFGQPALVQDGMATAKAGLSWGIERFGEVSFGVNERASYIGTLDDSRWEVANYFAKSYVSGTAQVLAEQRGEAFPSWSTELKDELNKSFAGVPGVNGVAFAPEGDHMKLVLKVQDWSTQSRLSLICKDNIKGMPLRLEVAPKQ